MPNSLCCVTCILDTQPLFDAAAADDYSWMPYQIVKAEYIPFQQKLAMEDDMYFVPSVVESKKISLSYAADLSDELGDCRFE